MRFPFYQQPDSMDCGPACLQMVARYHGKNFSLQFLREKTQIGKEGVNLLGIAEAAETIGFRTQSAKLSHETLTKEATLPAILHWNQDHFVVLYKIKKDKCFVADPAKGLIFYTSGEFKQHWISNKENGAAEGVALLLEPTPLFFNNENETDKAEKLSFKNIFHYLVPYKKLIFQLLLV